EVVAVASEERVLLASVQTEGWPRVPFRGVRGSGEGEGLTHRRHCEPKAKQPRGRLFNGRGLRPLGCFVAALLAMTVAQAPLLRFARGRREGRASHTAVIASRRRSNLGAVCSAAGGCGSRLLRRCAPRNDGRGRCIV